MEGRKRVDPKVEAAPERYISKLLGAVQKGDLKRTRELVLRGTNVNGTTADGFTALHMACYVDNVAICEFLLHSGADVTAKNAKGETPMQICSLKGGNKCAQPVQRYLSQLEVRNVDNSTVSAAECNVKIAELTNLISQLAVDIEHLKESAPIELQQRYDQQKRRIAKLKETVKMQRKMAPASAVNIREVEEENARLRNEKEQYNRLVAAKFKNLIEEKAMYKRRQDILNSLLGSNGASPRQAVYQNLNVGAAQQATVYDEPEPVMHSAAVDEVSYSPRMVTIDR